MVFSFFPARFSSSLSQEALPFCLVLVESWGVSSEETEFLSSSIDAMSSKLELLATLESGEREDSDTSSSESCEGKAWKSASTVLCFCGKLCGEGVSTDDRELSQSINGSSFFASSFASTSVF